MTVLFFLAKKIINTYSRIYDPNNTLITLVLVMYQIYQVLLVSGIVIDIIIVLFNIYGYNIINILQFNNNVLTPPFKLNN